MRFGDKAIIISLKIFCTIQIFANHDNYYYLHSNIHTSTDTQVSLVNIFV